MATAGDVVELIAKVSIADVGLPQICGDVYDELDGREEEGEAQGGAQGGVGGADDGGARGLSCG